MSLIILSHSQLMMDFLTDKSKKIFSRNSNFLLKFLKRNLRSFDDNLKTFLNIDKLVLMKILNFLFETFDNLIFLQDFLLDPDDFILQLRLLFQLILGQLLDLIVPRVNLLQILDILITHPGYFILQPIYLLPQIFIFCYHLTAFRTLPIFLLQYLAGVQISILEIFSIIGLEFDQRLDVALDLPHHQVQLLYVIYCSLVFSTVIFLPDAFQQLEMLGLVRHHHLLLIGLLLVVKSNER